METPLEIATPQIVPELPQMEELPLQETGQIPTEVENIVQEVKPDSQERVPQEKPKEEPKKRRFTSSDRHLVPALRTK